MGVFVARAALAAPCGYPDEGTMPLHRAVRQVRLHPDIEGKLKE